MKKIHLCFSFIFIYISIFATGSITDATSIHSIDESKLNLELRNASNSENLISWKLENGMTIWLKPTSYESDIIYVKISALGGFAAVPIQDRFSAEIASQIAWESGFGQLSGDQVSVLLYEHSLEFVPRIEAFSRSIEAMCNKDNLKLILNCVYKVFRDQNFTEEGLKGAKVIAKNTLHKASNEYERAYDAALLQFNTNNLELFRPMNVSDLDKVDFYKAKEFFSNCFLNPEEFSCIIVGDFKVEEMKVLLEGTIGKISKARSNFCFSNPLNISFPIGIAKKKIYLPQRPDSLTRITFPLSISLNDQSIHKLAFLCQVIEARLKRIITDVMKVSYGIDVSYEFPLYPFLENPLISIRFRCEENLEEKLEQMILKELENLKTHGVKEEEIEEIRRLEKGSDEFWLRDNFYWVSMLTNYFLWSWDPHWIYKAHSITDDLSQIEVNDLLKNLFTLKNYSILIATP